METQCQGDFFDGDSSAHECISCGGSFVPQQEHHKLCDNCYENKQK
jgi:hypothetical protein